MNLSWFQLFLFHMPLRVSIQLAQLITSMGITMTMNSGAKHSQQIIGTEWRTRGKEEKKILLAFLKNFNFRTSKNRKRILNYIKVNLTLTFPNFLQQVCYSCFM